jgi:ribosomal protein S18 acetylase RimI-like enzyme
MVTVRPAADVMDVRAAIAVNRRGWRAAFGDILPAEALPDPDEDVSWAQAAAVYGEHADEEATRYLVAEAEDGDVVGYALFVRGAGTKDFVDPEAGEAELRALYVAPDHWAEGIGTRLLGAGIEDLPPSVDRVKLETFADNERGRAFYRARGFEAVGESTFEVEEVDYPTVIFARRVGAAADDRDQ